jgi:hypothetical protein
LIDVVEDLKLSKEGTGATSIYHQMILIGALRMMIAWKYDYHGAIFGFTDPQDQHFFRVYLSYLH